MAADEPLTIVEAGRALRAGTTTSRALVQAVQAAADQWEPDLGIFLARFNDTALQAADVADQELAAGVDRGPLHGIPLGVKDIIATAEGPTTAQSLVLEPDWTVAGQDAPVVARLRNAGAVIVGKTSTNEYAIGMPDASKPFPIPRNPWDRERWSGGSSAGTGNGMAAGAFLGGLGTDTGGSVRMPAAYCGVTGLKATFGRVPKSGCVPLGYTLDGVGPLARSAADCALMLSVMAGPDPEDPMSAWQPVEDYFSALSLGAGDLTGVRIGVDNLDRFTAATDDAWPALFSTALDELRAAGATIVDVELPLFRELVTIQSLTMASESAAYHMPDIQGRWADYSVGARYFFATGTTYSAPDYIQAQRVRRVGQKTMAALLTEVDLIVTPTSTLPAPLLAEMVPRRPRVSLSALHTFYWSSLGNPTMSVPVGFTGAGLPMAVQVSGRPFEDALVLRAGDAYQRRTDFHLARPVPRPAAAPIAVSA
ncbi:MAG: amidase [Frankiales bacterium]|nr:amidase [Frankiales bacterium]